MAIVETQDLEGTRQRLAGWLGRKLLQSSDRFEISELQIPQGAGHSNATLLFDARWTEDRRTIDEENGRREMGVPWRCARRGPA